MSELAAICHKTAVIPSLPLQHELSGYSLEGRGAMVCDHDCHLAYTCCLSRRCDAGVNGLMTQRAYSSGWFDVCDQNR